MSSPYNPPVAELIDVSDIPGDIESIESPAQDGVNALLSKIRYRYFVAEVSNSGDTSYYHLSILSKTLRLPLLDTGFVLVFFRDAESNYSEFPMTFNVSWAIKKYISEFSVQGFSYLPEAFVDILIELSTNCHLARRRQKIQVYLHKIRREILNSKNLNNLATEVNNLTPLKKQDFVADFLVKPTRKDSDLWLLNNDLTLVDEWSTVIHLKSSRVHVGYLKSYKYIKDNPIFFDHFKNLINTSPNGFNPTVGHHFTIFVHPNRLLNVGEFGNDTILRAEMNGHKVYQNAYFKKPSGIDGVHVDNQEIYYKKPIHGIINPQWSDSRIKEELAYAWFKRSNPEISILPPLSGSTEKRIETLFSSVFSDGTPLKIRHYDKQIYNNIEYENFISNFDFDFENFKP